MSGKRLLIVEDERQIQLTLKLYMQSCGYEVEVSDNGRQAWELVRERYAGRRCFDLILTDIRMPEMTGVELLEKMWEEGLSIPSVAMTGDCDEDSLSRLESVECFKVVHKPFAPSYIKNIIVDVLASKRHDSDQTFSD